ncbi:acetyl-CoA C-acetyltransferase [Bacillus piscicola]|uniref:acetyl-CoA C-acetyltransferase n=1 Tax=Bacillus piscicola TaxID=1632684 RepID=UPI001F08EE9A|nr:acetyl-CoA C-acetyltransferase [Bacillus piscicola]
MTRTVIAAGARTPFGTFGGSLAPLTAGELGGAAIKGVLSKTGTDPAAVEEVLMGNVLQGGQGQLPSRQAARNAGLPWEVTTETINKVCASGMRTVTMADQIIRAGDGEVVIAGGMESMSNAPYVVPKARWGSRMGDAVLQDMMIHDGLTCSFHGVHMGVYGNEAADYYGISREMQDRWALRSHERAGKAGQQGFFAEEIVPVEVPKRRSSPVLVTEDEAVRSDTTLEALRKLRPAFKENSTITAGNAPGVNDGACALLLMSDKRAAREGIQPLATITGHAALAVKAEDFPKTPGLVIQKLLKKTGRTLADIDVFEINEAFAAVALLNGKSTGIAPEKVNVNGGAVALGHPIGASGTRIILTLAHELRRRGGGRGIAAICSGGGQGDAVMIDVP